jgi:hypothetical protein
MRQKGESQRQPRRQFLAGVLAAVSGAAAWLSAPRRGRAAVSERTVPAKGPVLYRRTEEAERYYRTLYR